MVGPGYDQGARQAATWPEDLPRYRLRGGDQEPDQYYQGTLRWVNAVSMHTTSPPNTSCSMFYKDALKYGFYELQSSRDWYREVTADAGGMHVDLVNYWIRIAALIASPITPHFAEHIWQGILNEPTSIQVASWPEPETAVDQANVEAGAYMRGTVKMIRDAEVALTKKMSKGKVMSYDPKKPRAVRVYVASSFPGWQNICVKAIQEGYAPDSEKVDDAIVRQVLTANGLIKDKRAMPFVQAFKVCSVCFVLIGADVVCRNGCSRLVLKLRSTGRWYSPSPRC